MLLAGELFGSEYSNTSQDSTHQPLKLRGLHWLDKNVPPIIEENSIVGPASSQLQPSPSPRNPGLTRGGGGIHGWLLRMSHYV